VPIHHENEIAQSRGLTCNKEHTQANYWMHCEFLKIDGGKMSKSLGNIYTIKDLEQKGYSALDFRYFLLNANFRKSQNFTFKALESAKISRKRLNLQILDHFKEDVKLSNDDAYIKQLNDYKQSFLKAINYDLNIPDALSVMWYIVKMQPSKNVYNLILEFDKILGLNISSEVENLQKQTKISKDDIPKQIINIANERLKARQNKDFNKSDELRDKLKSLGYTVKDSKSGYEILKDR
jgi:cysteinyl-tRNA synthetase